MTDDGIAPNLLCDTPVSARYNSVGLALALMPPEFTAAATYIEESNNSFSFHFAAHGRVSKTPAVEGR